MAEIRPTCSGWFLLSLQFLTIPAIGGFQPSTILPCEVEHVSLRRTEAWAEEGFKSTQTNTQNNPQVA